MILLGYGCDVEKSSVQGSMIIDHNLGNIAIKYLNIIYIIYFFINRRGGLIIARPGSPESGGSTDWQWGFLGFRESSVDGSSIGL
ncbi:hypothetical protein V6N12_007343 [Hibiscus sabdariffa]|uniref:Uncharacterized protein n=1 Tax=Hibiscus sabdariffa TaxID=183260 RepID=A0ABR2F1I9_9ROSI